MSNLFANYITAGAISYALTPLIVIVCLISFFVLIFVRILTKTKYKVKDIVFILLLFLGIYQIIPFYFTSYGVGVGNPEYLDTALKLSMNPGEKVIIYQNLGKIYDKKHEFSNEFYSIEPDGNLAIEYYEKSLRGKYKNYPDISEALESLYLFKGDYEKVEKIESEINTENKFYITYSYIMQDKYKEALETCKTNAIHTKFLKADLYKATGQKELGEKLYKEAQDDYDEALKRYNTQEYKNSIETFSSIESVKKWVKESKEYYRM